jgi:uncharacterized coiled-coil DUF342 family protein
VPGVPPRPVLSEDEERAEWEDQTRLRAIDAKLDALFRQRQELITEMRHLSAEQKALYDRRQAPQEEVERLYEQHGELGKRLAALRGERDAARRKVDEAIIRFRELKLTFAPGERVNPDQLRREIAQLELRQQTHALPLEEENALIAHLRLRSKELKEAEARVSVVTEHERQRKEAEAQVAAARVEVDRLGQEWTRTRAERDAKMAAVRSMLETAGGLIAELRAKGRARAEVMEKIDTVSREMMELEREGRKLLGQTRARREEARRTLRTYTHHRQTPEDLLTSTAEAQLEELLRRGKITLGG